MILGQVAPYLRHADAHTRADIAGSEVAGHDIVTAALAYGVASGVDFFIDTLRGQHQRFTQLLAPLQARFGAEAARVRSTIELASLPPGEHLFHVATDHFVQLALARESAPRIGYPISVLVHTVPSPRFLLYYLGTCLLMRDHDALVVSTEAGRKALCELLEAARGLIERRGDPPTRYAMPRVVTIPFGVDAAPLASVDREAARAKFGIAASDLVVLYVGRLSEEYKADLEPLLRAIAARLPAMPQLRLVVAGTDSEERYGDTLRRTAQALGMPDDRLTILASFAYGDKPLVYGLADVFVSPVDNVQETFGLALIEAMAAGLPVIASDWSGYRELVVHGSTGFLVPTLWDVDTAALVSTPAALAGLRASEHVVAQATPLDLGTLSAYLDALLTKADLRRSMGARGRERVLARFTWETVIGELGALWREQLERVAGAAPRTHVPVEANFSRVFAHFATRPLDPHAPIWRTRRGDELLRHIDSGEPGPLPAWLEPSDVATILRRASPAAVEGDVAAPNGSSRTIAWLMKKGYLL